MKTLIAAAILALSLVAAQAHAADYTFAFTAPDQDLHGTLSTSSSGSSQLITGFTASYNGDDTALAPPGLVTINPSNDNLLYPDKVGVGVAGGSMGYLDGGGVGFFSGFGLYKIFHNFSNYTLYREGTGNIASGSFTLTAASSAPSVPSISAAPEPGAWALMLGGVGVLGAMMRVAQARRREDELKSIAIA